ncbi:hypothetical protein OIO90_001473 [Microbotryomycetes sp. JL221]|nr:hypothetical protein OIO90_001473 [Microbotryomycetes sp. JL221]
MSTTAATESLVSTRQAERINKAFTHAAIPSQHGTSSTNKYKSPNKGKRKMIIADDEEDSEQDDQDEFEEVNISASSLQGTKSKSIAMETTDILPLPIPGQPDETIDDAANGTGGGFIVDEYDDMSNGGGGFIADETMQDVQGESGGFVTEQDGGGGFLPQNDQFAGSGGFFAEDDNNNQFDSGGGFMPEEDGGTMGAGGFLPGDTDMPELPPLPDLPPVPATLDSAALAESEKTTTVDRISLHKIPDALRQLDLPTDSKDLMDLFREVASDDETVSRERFFEACATLMADDEDDDDQRSSDESSRGYKDEDSDDDSDDGTGKLKTTGSRLRRKNDATVSEPRQPPARRSTRANPAKDVEQTANAAIERARTREGDDVGEAEERAFDSDEDDAATGASVSSKKAAGGKGARSGRSKIKLKQARKLNAQEVRDAQDTYELFFEGDGRPGDAKDKVLTLADLQRVTRLLKEDMSEDDLQEMLEYAARERGQVDIEAFTKVLAEAL